MDREFLEAIATEYKLSAEQREAFLARFDPENGAVGEAKLANMLKIGASALKKRLTEVYKKLEPLCPELASTKRGKVEKLRAALQERFAQRELRGPVPEPERNREERLKPGEPNLDVLVAVNENLLRESEQKLVVSPIAGPGGWVEESEAAVKEIVLILPARRESILDDRWDQETMKIKNAVNRAYKDFKNIEVYYEPSINASNLAEELTRIEPSILHISGIADNINGLFLRNTHQDKSQELIASLLKEYPKISCIILSGCSSENQIREMIYCVEFVVSLTSDLDFKNTLEFVNEFYYQLASGQSVGGSYRLSLNRLKRLELSDRGNSPVLFERTVEIKRRETEVELEVCLKKIELNPDDVILLENQAKLLQELDRGEEAQKILDKAASLEPNKHSIRVLQGDALQQTGSDQRALEAYNQALETGLGEKDYKVWWKKARLLAKLEKYLESAESYRKALECHDIPSPDDYVICREYGSVQHKANRLNESVLLYHTALCVQPKYRLAKYEQRQLYKKMYSKK